MVGGREAFFKRWRKINRKLAPGSAGRVPPARGQSPLCPAPRCPHGFAAFLPLGFATKIEKMADLTELMQNEVFLAFASYATIVLLKMMLLGPATGFYRITRKAFANPEDCASFGKGEDAKKYLRTEDRVERTRRAHLNDLENIVPFLGIGLLYSLSGPDLSTALLHFRLFVGARIYHSIAYLMPLPQPNRALAFYVGYGVIFSMAYRLLKSKLYL
ncbi:hypothetical protein MC885_018879 [Smutsia gigantea]|nr:hypothetical protein MC885_018879 [Smutsia gigantea]